MEIDRPFLAAKGFNTNLVQFLNFYLHIMLFFRNVHVCSFTWTITDVH